MKTKVGLLTNFLNVITVLIGMEKDASLTVMDVRIGGADSG